MINTYLEKLKTIKRSYLIAGGVALLLLILIIGKHETKNQLETYTVKKGAISQVVKISGKVKAAQYVESHPGNVCPANWDEGDDTLEPGMDLVGRI